MTAAAPLVVGFDLDMTLIDTRPGFAATLRALSAETGVDFDVERMVQVLGAPLDLMLAPHFDAEVIPGLVDRFRLVIFPVITGRTGSERIYDGYPDVALELVNSRTFDGRAQLLEYIPTVLEDPPPARK